MGRSRESDGFPEGWRSFRKKRHAIYYTAIEDGVYIIGLPHCSVNHKAHFGLDAP